MTYLARMCRICVEKDCNCLCLTCKLTRIIDSAPSWVWEASDYTRKEWFKREMEKK